MPSRRRALQAAGGLLAGLAGCNAEPPSTATPGDPGPPADALTDPPTLSLRNPELGPVVSHPVETPTPERHEERDFWRTFFVADEETAAGLTFASVEGVETAQQFLEDTNFDGETVFVDQRELGECYERTLCWVRWADHGIETAYARGYRDADVACEAGASDVVATFVRLPVALDPDQMQRFGSSSRSGSCRPHRADSSAGEGNA